MIPLISIETVLHHVLYGVKKAVLRDFLRGVYRQLQSKGTGMRCWHVRVHRLLRFALLAEGHEVHFLTPMLSRGWDALPAPREGDELASLL